MDKQELIDVINAALPEIDLNTNQRLVTDGVLSSLSFVIIFSEISDHYHIEIPFEDMTPDNFDTLDDILNLIERLRK